MNNADFQKIKDNLQSFNRPIYETVITTLTELIESGKLAPGTKFPPDKKLAVWLGISHVTLARALNELRRRNILERRRAFGTFVPETRAPDPSVRTRKKIAVVFDDVSEKTFQQQLFLQLHHGLEALDCTMLFFSSNNDSGRQLEQLRDIVRDFSISGCIVWSILTPEQAEVILRERPRYYPLIFLDKYDPEMECDAVTYSNFECGAAIGRSLKRKKIRHCYWIDDASAKLNSSACDRRNGLMTALGKNTVVETVELEENSVLTMDFAADSAVICSDFLLAQRLKDCAAARGVQLPEQLITFETVIDDHELISEFTAYRFPCELGNEAISILSSRLNGKEFCTVNHSGKWSVLGAKPANAKMEKKE